MSHVFVLCDFLGLNTLLSIGAKSTVGCLLVCVYVSACVRMGMFLPVYMRDLLQD